MASLDTIEYLKGTAYLLTSNDPITQLAPRPKFVQVLLGLAIGALDVRG